jgi:hypothetical protein
MQSSPPIVTNKKKSGIKSFKRFYPSHNRPTPNLKISIIASTSDEKSPLPSPKYVFTRSGSLTSTSIPYSEQINLVPQIFKSNTEISATEEESETKSGGKQFLKTHSPKYLKSEQSRKSEESSGEPENPPAPNYIPHEPKLGKEGPPPPTYIPPYPALKYITNSPRRSTTEDSDSNGSTRSRPTLEVTHQIVRRVSNGNSPRTISSDHC